MKKIKKNNDTRAELEKQLRAKNREITHLRTLVEHDELTGLYNRRGFLSELQRFIDSIKNERILNKKHIFRELEIHNISVLFLDVDRFKKINDTHGHHIGHKSLKEIASVLKESARAIDVVGRWSGDEFIMGLVNLSFEDAQKKIINIRNGFEKHRKERKHSYPFPECSIGAATLYEKNRSPR